MNLLAFPSSWGRTYHVLRFLSLCALLPVAATLLLFTTPYWIGMWSERWLEDPHVAHSTLYSWGDGVLVLLILAAAAFVIAFACFVCCVLWEVLTDLVSILWEKTRP